MCYHNTVVDVFIHSQFRLFLAFKRIILSFIVGLTESDEPDTFIFTDGTASIDQMTVGPYQVVSIHKDTVKSMYHKLISVYTNGSRNQGIRLGM